MRPPYGLDILFSGQQGKTGLSFVRPVDIYANSGNEKESNLFLLYHGKTVVVITFPDSVD
jgi:hypothetical protein